MPLEEKPQQLSLATTNRIINNLPEQEFWELVSIRLNIPFSKNQIKDFKITGAIAEELKRDYWTEEFLIDKLFLQLAGTKIITVCKYYNQAFRLHRWIPIEKPTPQFIVNISDLELRTVAELRVLDKDGAQYVLKQAVGRVFENIDSTYHLSIARNLEVILKP
jgi:hypothetical protein